MKSYLNLLFVAILTANLFLFTSSLQAEEKKPPFDEVFKKMDAEVRAALKKDKNKIIIGSTDEYAIEPKENIFEELTDFLENKPPWLNKDNITKKWFGIRSRPEGEPSPILKSLEKGLILCSGFYKNGILLAPACSNWISNEIKEHLL